MEIQSVSSPSQTQTGSLESSGNVQLQAGVDSLKSSLDMQKLVLKLLEGSGLQVDTRA